MTAMLEVRDLRVSYGKIEAVKGISFSVDEGRVVTLIGTNGAGKTTTLRTISGLLRPSSGSISFQGKPIHSTAAHDIVALGIAHSPEGRRIFPRLSVEENLTLGAFARKDQAQIRTDLHAAYELFPILGERSKQAGRHVLRWGAADAGHGSGDDEPAQAAHARRAVDGAVPADDEADHVDRPDPAVTGTTILLVEQNAQAALKLADKGYVLEVGSIVLDGTGQELLASDDVRKAYLGED